MSPRNTGMITPELPAALVLPQVRLKIARRSGHPWIFQKMVEKPAAQLPPGSVVDIIDRDGQWVGRGFYNGHSRIALRVLSSQPEEAIDDAFFSRRLARAIELRRDWLELDAVSDAYRLVHSEGRRPERPGGRSLRLDAGAGVLRGRHVSLPASRSRRLAGSTFPAADSTGSPRNTCRSRNRSTAGRPKPPPPNIDHRARPAFPRRSRQQAQDRLLPRSARQPQAPGLVLRRQARAGPVLQQRRLRGLCQGPGRSRGGRSASTWTSRPSPWPSRTPI